MTGKKRRGRSFLMLCNILLWVLVVRYTFLFVLLMMLPTIVAYYTDVSERQYKFQTVFCCNLAGMLPYLVNLVEAGNGFSPVFSAITTPEIWLACYGAAAGGSLMLYIAPALIRALLSARDMKMVLVMEAEQKRLVEEWGPEIKRRELSGE